MSQQPQKPASGKSIANPSAAGASSPAQPTQSSRLPGPRLIGASINVWHVLAAFACMAASFLMLRADGVTQLRSLVADPAYFNSGNPLLFDQRRGGYTTEVANAHLAALGNAAVSYYADTYLALYDLLFPVLLLIFGVLLVLYATSAAHQRSLTVQPWTQRLMLLAPIALFVFDMAENGCLFSMLEMYPKVNDKLVETASMFTQLKWGAGFVEGLLFLGLIVHAVHRHIEPIRV